MAMTKEQLLIPRYMCTGTPGEPLWPGCPWNGYDVITFDIHDTGNICRVHPDLVDVSYFEKFPHLFRPMPWWEGRKPEDMPEYLRIKNKVLRVVKYNLTFGEFLPEKSKYMKRLEYTQPATEQEYLDYINQKEV